MIDSPKYLAFRKGIIYEGDEHRLWALYPTPQISLASCDFIEKESSLHMIFREDSFDAISRIRRGRIYRYHGKTEFTRNWNRDNVSNGLYGNIIGLHSDGKFDDYDSAKIAEPKSMKDAIGSIVEIGSSDFSLPWRVIGSERNIHGHVVFTIKSISFFGFIPELQPILKTKDGAVLDQTATELVVNSVNGLIDTLNTQQPTSVIDSARECCKIILTNWHSNEFLGKDLGVIARIIGKDRLMLSSAAHIINRLHANGKSAERENKKMKDIDIAEPSIEDAEISIYIVGLVIRLIGWARLS